MSQLTEKDFNEAVAAVQKLHPEFQVKFKDEGPWWLKLLCWFMSFINPEFNTQVTTTFGFISWMPSRKWLAANWEGGIQVLFHESTHVDDYASMGWFKFNLKYMGLMWLTLFALLCPLGILWKPLWFLALFLIFLAPWPCPGRVWLEARAYAVSLMVISIRGQAVNTSRRIFAEWLSGSSYYWPSWSKDNAVNVILDCEKNISESQKKMVQEYFLNR